MPKKLTIEEVKKFVEENSECELLSKEYIGNSTKMQFKCKCGNEFETTFSKFKERNKRQCNSCGIKIRVNKRIKSTKEVKQICRQKGYIPLFKKYENINKKITIATQDGYLVNVLLSNIINSANVDLFNKHNKFTIFNIKHYIKLNNIKSELLSNIYTTSSSKLKFKCKCGKIFYKSLNKFKDDNQTVCKECSIKNRNKNQTWNTEIFKQKVYKKYGNNYTVLEEYKTARTKIKVRHNKCGNEYYVQPYSLLAGNECRKCAIENMCGENHPNYNSNKTDEERLYNRYQLYNNNMKIWRNKIYNRDDYTCQCCGNTKSGILNAHHLNSWNWCKNKRFDVNNGITLCKDCHKEFHHIYGYGNNTKEQYEEFRKIKLKQLKNKQNKAS